MGLRQGCPAGWRRAYKRQSGSLSSP
jgi:hypothetical protein